CACPIQHGRFWRHSEIRQEELFWQPRGGFYFQNCLGDGTAPETAFLSSRESRRPAGRGLAEAPAPPSPWI
ncbi:hypothetical protein NDU88_006613, partial [Pleurodeles waltl]